jgi:DNA-binding NarL/FixJ family response regulator
VLSTSKLIDAAMSDPIPRPGAAPTAARTTVMMVDDHAATRSAVAALLNRDLPHCRLLPFDSAEQALDVCSSEPPTLVIMDIALPGMNGVEAASLIKHRHPEVTVVMLSNSDMQVYQDGAKAAGAAAFVSKRRIADELVAVLTSLLPA